jgi:hypothetical protein
MEGERTKVQKVGSSGRRLELVRKYWQFVHPYRFHLLLIVLLSIGSFIVPLTIPFLTQVLIDDVLLDGHTFWTLQRVVTVLAVILGLGIIISFIREYVTARVGNHMLIHMRRKLYEHLLNLSPQYYDNRQVGQIVSRMTHDVNGAQNLINGGVINLVADLFLVLFATVMLIIVDWRLACMALWILPMYYLTFTNINVRIRFAWRSVHSQMARIYGVFVERIGWWRNAVAGGIVSQCKTCPGKRVGRINARGFQEMGNSKFISSRRKSVQVIRASQVGLIGFRVYPPLSGKKLFLIRGKRNMHPFGNFTGYLAEHLQHVANIPVICLGPEVALFGINTNELKLNPDVVAGTVHRTFDNMIHSKPV